MQVSPPQALSPYIKHYIFLENSENDCKKLRLFADGNTGLIISSDINMKTDDLEKNVPLSFFYGQPIRYKDLTTKGSFSLIAVVFQPYFFTLLFGISAREIKNEIISVAEILKNDLLPFQESLHYKKDPKSIIEALNIYFMKLITKEKSSDLSFIKETQQYILRNRGNISLQDLEHFTGYSERHIERKFVDHIGLSPKKYSTVIRLHYFLSLMQKNSQHENLTRLSYEAGYADHSHLIKDFKMNIGLTPSQYLKTQNKLAVNFIELS